MTSPSRLVFTVRVDFAEGDHAFWGTRRSARRALGLRARLQHSCVGYRIRTFTVVAMPLQDWRAHLRLERCISPVCPSIPQPERPGWGDGCPADGPVQLSHCWREASPWFSPH